MWCIFPGHFRKIRDVDEAFAAEAAAARAAGFQIATIDHDAAEGGDVSRALRALPPVAEDQRAIYRGWMLRPDRYTQLYQGLRDRGFQWATSPASYRLCHYLPENYALIADVTAATRWIPWAGRLPTDDELRAQLEPFNDAPLVLKDYVKSQKHYWLEACFIPRASDLWAVQRIVSRFAELQGGSPEGGLVFREFVPLQPIEATLPGQLPATLEYRTFWASGWPILIAPYWQSPTYPDAEPPVADFESLASGIPSPLFTMDIARRASGEWMVVELGDGQVAGLPPDTDALRFFERLKQSFELK